MKTISSVLKRDIEIIPTKKKKQKKKTDMFLIDGHLCN